MILLSSLERINPLVEIYKHCWVVKWKSYSSLVLRPRSLPTFKAKRFAAILFWQLPSTYPGVSIILLTAIFSSDVIGGQLFSYCTKCVELLFLPTQDLVLHASVGSGKSSCVACSLPPSHRLFDQSYTFTSDLHGEKRQICLSTATTLQCCMHLKVGYFLHSCMSRGWGTYPSLNQSQW